MINAVLLVLIFEGLCLLYFLRNYMCDKNINNLVIAVCLLVIFIQPVLLSFLDVENLIGGKTENAPLYVRFSEIISAVAKISLCISAFFLYKDKKRAT